MGFVMYENLKGFASSKPPMVVFMVCLGAFAVVLLTMGYIVKVRDQLKNHDLSEDWNTFLENFADVEFCVLGNSSDADIYNPSTSPKLSNALSGLQKNFPGSVSHNITTTTEKVTSPATVDEILNVSVSMWVEIRPTADFVSIPHNMTYLMTSMNGSQLGLEGEAADMELNVTFTLPFEWNSTQCMNGYCTTVQILTCINFQAPAKFFPRTRQPDICLSKNESGVEYHTRMVGFPIGSMMECRKNPVLRVKYQLNPQLTMMLSLHDRSVINLHLMHTSYFLFVMVVMILCYALVKGKPLKTRAHVYVEVNNHKSSNSGV